MVKLLFVSGLSGSGKSIALQTLEDEGFFCVDNLPLTFVPLFLEKIAQQPYIQKLAIGIDARGFPEDLTQAETIFEQINANTIYKSQLVFLQASEKTLLKRYSETRRKHPLSQKRQGLIDSIQYERKFLNPIYNHADVIIDTSELNVHELRATLKERVLENNPNKLFIQIESFGFRNGLPLDADFVFDARCLTNPHWEVNLRSLTGLDKTVCDFFEQTADMQEYYHDISQFIMKWVKQFEKGTRSYLSIAIGCTGGQHRSVYLSQRLYVELKQHYSSLSVKHRELSIKY